MDSLISVIIPVYNAAPFIERCAKSLLAQTYRKIELVFVDDASEDDGITILKCLLNDVGIQDITIRIVENRHVKGPGGARQTGVDLARGEWCSFVDSDDWVDPDYIKHLVAVGLRDGDFVMSGVCHDYESDVASWSTIINQSISEARGVSAEVLRDVIKYSYPVGKLFQCRLVKEHKIISQDISLHEDTAFIIEYLGLATRIILIGDVDYHYIHRNSNSLTRQHRSPKELITISNVLFHKWENFFEAYPTISPMVMRQCIQRYGLSQLLQAVFSAFASGGMPSCERMNVLSAVKARRSEFIKYYRPRSMFVAVVLWLTLNIPSCMLNVVFFVGVSIVSSLKKINVI